MSRVVTMLTTTSGSATGNPVTPTFPNPGAGGAIPSGLKFQATEAGTGAVSATVVIECTNDTSVTTSWMTVGTITLSGTTTAADGFTTLVAWPAYRARTTAISGTGATVTVTMGA